MHTHTHTHARTQLLPLLEADTLVQTIQQLTGSPTVKNSIRKGRELGKPLVVAGCVPQGQKNHADVQGLSVVGVGEKYGNLEIWYL